jgi:uroporphyrinogen-III synthase
MRLLLTRPMADALILAEQLAGQGHDVVLAPMIDIKWDIDAPLPHAAAYGAVAFTSANGVRALLAQLASKRAQAQDIHAWLALPAFAVGPQTAAAAQAAGFSICHQASGDVAALAQLIGAHHQGALPVLHIAGRHRAGDLAALLAEKNVSAQRAVLYQAQAAEAFGDAARAALSDGDAPVEGVLLYSQRSAMIFAALYDALPSHEAPRPTAYCLSEPIAEAMRAAGFAATAPPQADGAALMAMLAV